MRLRRPGKPEEAAAADGQSVICHPEGKSVVLCRVVLLLACLSPY